MSANNPTTRPHVVIIGGGFGGLYAARALSKQAVDVTLIDRQNHHLFQPLLYQVATSALAAPDIAAPIRKILRKQENIKILLANVTDIDIDARKVVHEEGALDYDYLIVAAGAVNNYFGNDDWVQYAPGLKTLADAFEVRKRVLLAYEAAELEDDPEIVKEWLTFVVVGGGPTGVEMAGALKEIATRTMTRNFRSFDPADARVVLVEGLDRLLNGFPEKLSESAKKQLEDLGVEVRLETMVEAIDDTCVEFTDGDSIRTRTVVWGAGVKASPLAARIAEQTGDELGKGGRIVVEADMSVPGHPEIFVIGDMAQATDANGEEVPGLAPAAMQAGTFAGEQIGREHAGKERDTFEYLDKGIMATIGRSRAVAQSGSFKFSGLTAWLAWLFIHVIFLVGFRNRVAVLLEWAWAYFTFQRSARIVVSEEPKALIDDVRPEDEVDVEDETESEEDRAA